MNNLEVRQAIFDSRIKKKDIAKEIGIKPNTLTQWFRKDLNTLQRTAILNVVEKLREKQNNG